LAFCPLTCPTVVWLSFAENGVGDYYAGPCAARTVVLHRHVLSPPACVVGAPEKLAVTELRIASVTIAGAPMTA